MQHSNYLRTSATPPLHHPAPQHYVPIPVMHSPTLPEISNNYNSPYVTQSPHGLRVPQHTYGSFFTDPTTQMAFQVGGRATEAAGVYVEQNFGKYIKVGALKHYFDVSNSYVFRKLSLVLFPWRHKSWSRAGSQRTGVNGQIEGFFLPPRDDINSPDMYIPVMAFTTYILISTLISGLAGHFNPEQLGHTSSFALTVVLLEIGILKIGCYLLSITNENQLLDLVAYSGYKFAGIGLTLVARAVVPRWAAWAVGAYCFNANAFFLLRSLKYVLLPESASNEKKVGRMQRSRRMQFLFLYGYGVQLAFMWLLSRET